MEPFPHPSKALTPWDDLSPAIEPGEDSRREGRRAAAVDEAEQLVEIDIAVRRERTCQRGVVACMSMARTPRGGAMRVHGAPVAGRRSAERRARWRG
jgi:hypothetical protein